MDTSKLRPDTLALWQRLEAEPLLAGFVLIGGTALTLRIGHRVSEDLDFAYLGETLPQQRLRLLPNKLAVSGMSLMANQNPSAEDEFIDAGLELADYQQDYLCAFAQGRVKLSFVKLDKETTALFSGDSHAPMRVATLDEIFKTKALVSAQRSKTRDWFDLYILMTQHGYTMADLHRVFVDVGHRNGFEIAAQRLRKCKASSLDEGYQDLLSSAPALSEICAYFNQTLDQLEINLSAAAFRAKKAESNE